MPSRRRTLAAVALLTLAGSLVAADWLVRDMATPTYTTCSGKQTSLLVSGFGSDRSPAVVRACDGERRIETSARMTGTGILELTSATPFLLAFDGRQGTGEVRVYGEVIDHRQDLWWMRGLDLVTPFADFDQSFAFGETPDRGITRREVGTPRTRSTASGGSVATIEVGTNADDPSFTLYAGARGARQDT